ncbi:PREDICTED: steroid 17-alpha-hydroxylase/17,20 lyase [Gavialis gangeticus]|uniref:steroid 17-alpha-hydroxylase/17,20 lyase n=1 Tax=Gavialis gangeticus TaxID=94835 RepID=UPI00092EB16E|nr:PREDICTED: steroid 17-alpha-hydroxylase/17,20 lyase [Gavialis gangeticus]
MVSLVLGALLLALALLALRRLARDKVDAGHRAPPCLPSLPVLGSLLQVAGHSELHTCFTSLQARYGCLYALRLGSEYLVVVNNHLHAREVLFKKGKEFAGRPHSVTSDLMSRGGKDIAFASYSPLWRLQRKLVHTALSMFGEGSEALQKIVCREAEGLCEVLAATQGAPLAMAPELTRAVTNVVCSLCFNSSYRRGDPEFETMLQYSQGIVDTVGKESLVDIFPWLQYFPNKGLAWLRQCIKARDELLQKKFTEHKKAFCSDSVSDLMDALLRAKFNMENNNSRLDPGLELSDDHLLMTVGDIFGAGVETTTTALKWAVIYMLHYPEVQRKIQEELDQQLGLERRPQLSDRQRLPYLEATISEVLRIRPVAPLLIPHVALVDSSIGDYIIPKGAHVIVNIWAIHHDEDEWDKPEEFNPGRFLDERGQRIYSPTPSYMPFGSGVRACLGEVLAKMELFLLLSWILQRFTLELPPHHPLPSLAGKFGIVLQATGFDVKAVPREPGRAGP